MKRKNMHFWYSYNAVRPHQPMQRNDSSSSLSSVDTEKGKVLDSGLRRHSLSNGYFAWNLESKIAKDHSMCTIW
jgi:hypothetical protein